MNIQDEMKVIDSLDFLDDDIKADIKAEMKRKWEISSQSLVSNDFPLLFNNDIQRVIGRVKLSDRIVETFCSGTSFRIDPIRRINKENKKELLALTLTTPFLEKKDIPVEEKKQCQICGKVYSIKELNEYYLSNPIILCFKCHDYLFNAVEKLKDRFGKELRAEEITRCLEKFIVNLKKIDHENK